MRVVTRGRLRQLENPRGGGAPEARLYACEVLKPPYDRGGKTYVQLALGLGDVDVLRRIDDLIHQQARPAFSPLSTAGDGLRVVAKLPGTARFEDVAGDPCPRWQLHAGQRVDVVLEPGAFGDFGYCLLVRRIKPTAGQDDGPGAE